MISLKHLIYSLGYKNESKVGSMLRSVFIVVQIVAISGFLFIFNAFSAQAALPSVINYQGKLNDSAGEPVSGEIEMYFAIYDAATGGNCLWSAGGSCVASASVTVTVDQGLFTVLLGDTDGDDNYDAMNVFGSEVFADGGRFLAVRIGTDSDMSPRKEIAATPYAVNADYLDGLNTSVAGGEDAYVPVTDAFGNLLLTGAAESEDFDDAVFKVNTAVAMADYALFGLGVNDTEVFRIDAEGDVFAAGDLVLNDYLYFGGVTTSAAIYFDDSDFLVNENWLPVASDTYSLGSDDYRWKDLYLSSNSLHIGLATEEFVVSYYNGAGGDSANAFDLDALVFSHDGAGGSPVAFLGDGGVVIGGTDRPDVLAGMGAHFHEALSIRKSFSGNLNQGVFNVALLAGQTVKTDDAGLTGEFLWNYGGYFENLHTNETYGAFEAFGGESSGLVGKMAVDGDFAHLSTAYGIKGELGTPLIADAVGSVGVGYGILGLVSFDNNDGMGTHSSVSADELAALAGRVSLTSDETRDMVATKVYGVRSSASFDGNNTRVESYSGLEITDLQVNNGSAVTIAYGVKVGNMGSSGVLASYGLYVDSGNAIALYTAGGQVVLNDEATAGGSMIVRGSDSENFLLGVNAEANKVGIGDFFNLTGKFNISNGTLSDPIIHLYNRNSGNNSSIFQYQNTNPNFGLLSASRSSLVLVDDGATGSLWVKVNGDVDTEGWQRLVTANELGAIMPTGSTPNTTLRFDGVDSWVESTGLLVDASGVATVSSDLNVGGNTVLGNASSDSVTFNAATLSVPNNLNIDSNTLFVDAANNRVGVGTATPQSKFHILQETGVTNDVFTIKRPENSAGLAFEFWTGGGAFDVINNAGTATARIRSYPGSATNYSNGIQAFFNAGGVEITGYTSASDYPALATYNSSNNPLFIVRNDGNVGIGTTTPSTSLDVAGNIQIRGQNELRLADSDSTNYLALRAPETIGADYTLTLPDTDGDAGQVLVSDGSGVLSWAAGLQSGTNANEILRWTGSAWATTAFNVTATNSLAVSLLPAQTDTYDLGSTDYRWADLYLESSSLHIGDSLTDEVVMSYSSTNNRFNFINAGAAGSFVFMDSGNNPLLTVSSSSNQARVGIGTATPGSTLTIDGGSSDADVSIRAASGDAAIYMDAGEGETSYIHFVEEGNKRALLRYENSTNELIFSNVNGVSFTSPAAGYMAIGDSRAGNEHIDGIGDLYVQGDLEVDGTIYGNISGDGVGGFTPGSVIYADGSGYLTDASSGQFYFEVDSIIDKPQIGLGTTSPSGSLHVYDTSVIESPGLVIQTQTSSAIKLMSEGPKKIQFFDWSNTLKGSINYSDTNQLSLNVNGTDRMTIGSTGLVRIGSTGGAGYSTNAGDLYIDDRLEVDGNVYLGDQTTDLITLAGTLSLAGSSVFNTNNGNYDFVVKGDSENNLFYVDANGGPGGWGGVGINTNSTASASFTIAQSAYGGTEIPQLAITYDGSVYSTVQMDDEATIRWLVNGFSNTDFRLDANFLPEIDNTYSLGSTDRRWKDLYLEASTLHIGTSASDEGQIGYDTTDNILQLKNTVSGGKFQLLDEANRVLFHVASQSNSLKVAIGTDEPIAAADLDIINTGNFTLGTTLSIRRNDDDVKASDWLGRIMFGADDIGTHLNYYGAAIVAQAEMDWDETGDYDQPTSLNFFTQAYTAANYMTVPRMSINALGQVTIGYWGGLVDPLINSPAGLIISSMPAINPAISAEIILESYNAAAPSSLNLYTNGGTWRHDRLLPTNGQTLGTINFGGNITANYTASGYSGMIIDTKATNNWSSTDSSNNSSLYIHKKGTAGGFSGMAIHSDGTANMYGTVTFGDDLILSNSNYIGLSASDQPKLQFITATPNRVDLLAADLKVDSGDIRVSDGAYVGLYNWVGGVNTAPRLLFDQTAGEIEVKSGNLIVDNHLYIANNKYIGVSSSGPNFYFDSTYSRTNFTGNIRLSDAYMGSSSTGTRMYIDGTNGEIEFLNSDVGIGDNSPAYRLSVSDSDSSGHVAKFVNTYDGNGADGVLVQLGETSTLGTGNYFIEFKNGNGTTVGRIRGDGVNSDRVVYDTDASDFAEYMRAAEPDIPAGMIVSLNSSGLIKKATFLESTIIGVISDSAGFVGNGKYLENEDYALVGMVGQVKTYVTGNINPGDPITISTTDGVGRKALIGERTIGIAQEGHEGDSIERVNVLITRNNNDLANFLTSPIFKADLIFEDGYSLGLGDTSPLAALTVGSDLNLTYASGSGSVYVSSDLEVDGVTYLTDLRAAGQIVASDGLITLVKNGTISDSDFSAVDNGLIAIDSTPGAEKIFFRTAGGNWEYVNTDAASFFVPSQERVDPFGTTMDLGSFVVGMVDREVATTGELHAVYIDFKSALEQSLPGLLTSLGIAENEALIEYWTLDDKEDLVVENKAFGTKFLTSEGERQMYAMEADNAELMISGSSHLVDGRQSILFSEVDPTFVELISSKVPFKVILTPTSSSYGLAVAEKMMAEFGFKNEAGFETKPTGFKVVETNEGTSQTTFDWMVIARRVGYEKPAEIEAWERENCPAEEADLTDGVCTYVPPEEEEETDLAETEAEADTTGEVEEEDGATQPEAEEPAAQEEVADLDESPVSADDTADESETDSGETDVGTETAAEGSESAGEADSGESADGVDQGPVAQSGDETTF